MEFSMEERKKLIKKYGLNKTDRLEFCLIEIDKFIEKKDKKIQEIKIQDIYDIGFFIGILAFFLDDLPETIKYTVSELHTDISLNTEKYLR